MSMASHMTNIGTQKSREFFMQHLVITATQFTAYSLHSKNCETANEILRILVEVCKINGKINYASYTDAQL